MKYTLPPLPYAHDALIPVLDEETLRVHHGKHHQGYTNKLNAVVEDLGIDHAQEDLDALIATIDAESPAGLRNNLGGFVNHNLYWENLAEGGKAPSEKFMKVLEAKYENMEALKTSIVDLGMSQFGSGWAWIAVDANGGLMNLTTGNQDHPMMPLVSPAQGGTFMPIMTIDVWEHAYYLQYKSSRKEYLEQIFDLINWEIVEKRYFDALEAMNVECPYEL